MKCRCSARRVAAASSAHLRRRLLVAALPHVADAQVGQQLEVGDGEELGHHHERDVGAVAVRPRAQAARMRSSHLREPAGQLAARRSCAAASLTRRPAGQQAYDAGEATGLPVPPVGVQVG